MSHSQKTGRMNETILEQQQRSTRIQERFKSNNSNNQKGGNQKENTGNLHALIEMAEKNQRELGKSAQTRRNKLQKTQTRRKSCDFF